MNVKKEQRRVHSDQVNICIYIKVYIIRKYTYLKTTNANDSMDVVFQHLLCYFVNTTLGR